MIIGYKGVCSNRLLVPGGSPQGTLLGVLLYLVYVSDIVIDLSQALPAVAGIEEVGLKYVDELSLAQNVRLDTQLHHDHSGYYLPARESLLQRRVMRLKPMT